MTGVALLMGLFAVGLVAHASLPWMLLGLIVVIALTPPKRSRP